MQLTYVNIPSQWLEQHSPEPTITFMFIGVLCMRHRKQIYDCVMCFWMRSAVSSPETIFPVYWIPTGMDKLLSNDVIIPQFTSVTNETFRVAGSGDVFVLT